MALGLRLSKALGKTQTIPALIWLIENEGASANKLARGIGTDANTATEVANHLARHELAKIAWVESQFPGQKAMAVSLTAIGRRLGEDLRKLAVAHEEHLAETGAHPPPGMPRGKRLDRK